MYVAVSHRSDKYSFRSAVQEALPMKKSRFAESQIVALVREGEAGMPVAEILWSTSSVAKPTSRGNRSTATRA